MLSAAAPGAPACREIGRFLGEVGVLSVCPARSFCAKLHGAIPSGIRWGAGAIFCSAPPAPFAQGQQPGSSWCWKGGSSEGSGSSRSTSAQQQHQKNNPGSSGSGSGGAAPQRTVQLDASSTTASAPVVPSAAAPGAMPAAAPGVSSQSPWYAGWSSYPPAVPFETSGASPPAQLARPWRQVWIAAPRNSDEVPVEFEDKYVTAELCLPGQRSRGAIALRAILDSGAHFTSLSLPMMEMMERTFPGCLLYTSPSPRDKRQSRMPSSA